jgi:hypothetical protein
MHPWFCNMKGLIISLWLVIMSMSNTYVWCFNVSVRSLFCINVYVLCLFHIYVKYFNVSASVRCLFKDVSMSNVFSVYCWNVCVYCLLLLYLLKVYCLSFFLCLMNLMCNSLVLCFTYSLSFATMCFVSQSVKSDGNF